jgi:hypothetical protein
MEMARKGKSTEEIIGILGEAEVRFARGKTIGKICRSFAISEQTLETGVTAHSDGGAAARGTPWHEPDEAPRTGERSAANWVPLQAVPWVLPASLKRSSKRFLMAGRDNRERWRRAPTRWFRPRRRNP